ncbi:Gfo/Idh/MocA family protein [Paenibacillus glycanilyticus]|uniref:Oxidoreductase n=1 Tax=Paenibacillus glycanilyticus TaxID=126569 RepID=A0ABQ6GDJ6_9BACL|nr:Gfo/Idh/MocA family oxidoreductase [Paenibacillus glycanilyticus]GLX68170.1 oxidoreductase [Paenibacillus glycanilyticus]
MKKFKVGLVGAGGVSELHLEGYKANPERVTITAICDSNEEILHSRADKYGIEQRFTDLNAFIQNSGVDAAVVCTPTSVRKQVVIPLLEAGIPLLVEKPFSDTISDAIEITEKAKQLNVPVAVNQNFRRHYPFEIVKNIVAEQAIGKVTMILFNEMFFRQDAGWRLNQERHALSVMGIHWFDGFRQILGCEAESVVSLMNSSDAINCKGETDATVQLRFENGTIVTYTQSFSSRISRTEMIVIGEKGTVKCNHNRVELYLGGDHNPYSTWDNHYSREQNSFDNLEQLLTWIETGKVASNSAEDNLKTVALLDASYRSAAESQIIRLSSGIRI